MIFSLISLLAFSLTSNHRNPNTSTTVAAFSSLQRTIIPPSASLPSLTTLKSSSTNSNTGKETMRVVQLARYPIKGLAPDSLSEVHISSDDFISTFPDDRRFALLQQKQNGDSDSDSDSDTMKVSFDPKNPKWIHKEHFLCAFTEPEFLAKFDCKYQIVTSKDDNDTHDATHDDSNIYTESSYSYCLPNDDIISTNTQSTAKNQSIQRLLSIYKRQYEHADNVNNHDNHVDNDNDTTDQLKLLGPIDLNTSNGQKELEEFFMKEHKKDKERNEEESKSPILKCITAKAKSPSSAEAEAAGTNRHIHQFGNTSSGIKNNNNDTRTIHIINLETVKEFSSKLNIDIDPMRFRPNLVISGLDPWKEFDLVGKTLKVVSSTDDNNYENENSAMKIEVLSTTVRCAGVGVDPSEHPDQRNTLDIPKLLSKHYPQYGPYLGVYATIRSSGSLCVGDTIELYD
jgi:uncharacterized protein YcbX